MNTAQRRNSAHRRERNIGGYKDDGILQDFEYHRSVSIQALRWRTKNDGVEFSQDTVMELLKRDSAGCCPAAILFLSLTMSFVFRCLAYRLYVVGMRVDVSCYCPANHGSIGQPDWSFLEANRYNYSRSRSLVYIISDLVQLPPLQSWKSFES